MLDGVKGGDAVELSPLLALLGAVGVEGSSFSHIVLISELWFEVWLCESSRGSPRSHLPGFALSAIPCNPRLAFESSRLTRASSPSASQLSRLLRPPFSLQQEGSCVWEAAVFLPLLFQAPLPCPEPLLQTPALYVFYGCC